MSPKCYIQLELTTHVISLFIYLFIYLLDDLILTDKLEQY